MFSTSNRESTSSFATSAIGAGASVLPDLNPSEQTRAAAIIWARMAESSLRQSDSVVSTLPIDPLRWVNPVNLSRAQTALRLLGPTLKANSVNAQSLQQGATPSEAAVGTLAGVSLAEIARNKLHSQTLGRLPMPSGSLAGKFGTFLGRSLLSSPVASAVTNTVPNYFALRQQYPDSISAIASSVGGLVSYAEGACGLILITTGGVEIATGIGAPAGFVQVGIGSAMLANSGPAGESLSRWTAEQLRTLPEHYQKALSAVKEIPELMDAAKTYVVNQYEKLRKKVSNLSAEKIDLFHVMNAEIYEHLRYLKQAHNLDEETTHLYGVALSHEVGNIFQVGEKGLEIRQPLEARGKNEEKLGDGERASGVPCGDEYSDQQQLHERARELKRELSSLDQRVDAEMYYKQTIARFGELAQIGQGLRNERLTKYAVLSQGATTLCRDLDIILNRHSRLTMGMDESEKFQARFEALGSIGSMASVCGQHFKDRGLQKFGAAVNSGMTIYQSMGMLTRGSLSGIAALGPIGAMAGAGLAIVSLFSKGKGNEENRALEEIMQGIHALSQQMHDMHVDLKKEHAQTRDVVVQGVHYLRSVLSHEFTGLSQQMKAHFDTQQQSLDDLSRTLLDSIQESRLAPFNRALSNAEHSLTGHWPSRGKNTEQEILGLLRELHRCSTAVAGDPWLTGAKLNSASQEEKIDQPNQTHWGKIKKALPAFVPGRQAVDFAYLIGYCAQHKINAASNLVNPLLWLRATGAYCQVRKKFPTYTQDPNNLLLSQMVNAGKEVLGFLYHIQQADFVNQVLNDYVERLQKYQHFVEDCTSRVMEEEVKICNRMSELKKVEFTPHPDHGKLNNLNMVQLNQYFLTTNQNKGVNISPVVALALKYEVGSIMCEYSYKATKWAQYYHVEVGRNAYVRYVNSPIYQFKLLFKLNLGAEYPFPFLTANCQTHNAQEYGAGVGGHESAGADERQNRARLEAASNARPADTYWNTAKNIGCEAEKLSEVALTNIIKQVKKHITWSFEHQRGIAAKLQLEDAQKRGLVALLEELEVHHRLLLIFATLAGFDAATMLKLAELPTQVSIEKHIQALTQAKELTPANCLFPLLWLENTKTLQTSIMTQLTADQFALNDPLISILKSQLYSLYVLSIPNPIPIQLMREQLALEEKPLSNGANGIIFRGTFENQSIIFKQFLSQSFDQHAECKLHEEVERLTRLQSPHLVKHYGYCIKPYGVVMEYMENGDLHQLLHKPAELGWLTRYQIATDISQGLADLHAARILHGDLKSPNVFLDANGRAKLGDFGLPEVDFLQASSSKQRNDEQSVTYTVGWAAPETIPGERPGVPINPATDVYSLGVILWEILTREMPYKTACIKKKVRPQFLATEILYNRVQLEYPAEETLSREAQSLIPLIKRCLDRNPRNRPTAQEVANQIAKMALEIQGVRLPTRAQDDLPPNVPPTPDMAAHANQQKESKHEEESKHESSEEEWDLLMEDFFGAASTPSEQNNSAGQSSNRFARGLFGGVQQALRGAYPREQKEEESECIVVLRQIFEGYAQEHNEENALEILVMQFDLDEKTLVQVLSQARLDSIRLKIQKMAAKPDEREALIKHAQEQGFEVKQMERKGNCLYLAVADQLERTGQAGCSHESLRSRAMAHLVEHRERYHYTSQDVAALSRGFENREWAGQEAIVALSRELKKTIVVLYPDAAAPIVVKQQGRNEIKDILFIGFEGHHYQSLIPIDGKVNQHLLRTVESTPLDDFDVNLEPVRSNVGPSV